MSKLQKRLIIMFCIGVFLCGIGAGVMFVEFSGLTYGGKQVLGTADMRTENFDVQFESENEKYDIVGNCWVNGRRIQADESIPENTVRFCTTYNAECIEPYAYVDEEDKRIVFSYSWCGEDEEMPFIMEAKDVFLKNLKEGKLVSFYRPEITDVTVLVNPMDLDDVHAY